MKWRYSDHCLSNESLSSIWSTQLCQYAWSSVWSVCLANQQKKYFLPGGMAASEWTRSGLAVRATPEADYSAASMTLTGHIALRPLIAVPPVLHAVSVSDFRRTIWCCGQPWPCVGMGSLGTRLHRDGTAMGYSAIISPCVPCTYAQNAIPSLLLIPIISSRQIYVAIDNPMLVPSITSRTTGGNLCNYMHAADDVSHTENLQSNGCLCYSHLFKFWDNIHVTQVFRYCRPRQG